MQDDERYHLFLCFCDVACMNLQIQLDLYLKNQLCTQKWHIWRTLALKYGRLKTILRCGWRIGHAAKVIIVRAYFRAHTDQNHDVGKCPPIFPDAFQRSSFRLEIAELRSANQGLPPANVSMSERTFVRGEGVLRFAKPAGNFILVGFLVRTFRWRGRG